MHSAQVYNLHKIYTQYLCIIPSCNTLILGVSYSQIKRASRKQSSEVGEPGTPRIRENPARHPKLSKKGEPQMIVYFRSLATGQCYFGKDLPAFPGYVEITEAEWLAWYKLTF